MRKECGGRKNNGWSKESGGRKESGWRMESLGWKESKGSKDNGGRHHKFNFCQNKTKWNFG